MNVELFIKRFKEKYIEYCEKSYVYKSLDHSWIVVLKLPNSFDLKIFDYSVQKSHQNSKNPNIEYQKYKTYECSHLTPKLIINKFDFTTKTKASDTMRINYTIKDDIVFSQSLEKEYYSYLITHPTYTGYIVRWYVNGAYLSKGNYFNGQKNGYWILWYDNGEKHIEGLFIDNKKNGMFTEYSKIGAIYRKSYFIEDELDGEYIVYYPNGNIQKSGKYEKGKKTDIWKYNDEKGNNIKIKKYFSKNLK